MTISDLDSLAALIIQERQALLSRWRRQVRELPSARHLNIPTLNDHIPQLLDELAQAIQTNSDQSIPETLSEGSSPAHGLQRVKDAYDIEEVVAEYNILRGCIHDLADDHGIRLQGKPFHILNRVFDHAIGLALKAYATQRSLELQLRWEEHLAFVTHDLRTPLNAISMAGRVLEMLHPESHSPASSNQMLKALRRNVQQLEGLVAKVLDGNKSLEAVAGIKLERREFDLWSLVEDLIYDLSPVAKTAGTRFINKVPDDLVVYADAGMLRRLLQNLMANAIKYTPQGEIIVGAQELVEQGFIECWVSDNGAGIPAALIDKVFDKGETDPVHDGGLGLGLAIVKSFAEAHGGAVCVESTEGCGATFRFTLPTKASVFLGAR